MGEFQFITQELAKRYREVKRECELLVVSEAYVNGFLDSVDITIGPDAVTELLNLPALVVLPKLVTSKGRGSDYVE